MATTSSSDFLADVGRPAALSGRDPLVFTAGLLLAFLVAAVFAGNFFAGVFLAAFFTTAFLPGVGAAAAFLVATFRGDVLADQYMGPAVRRRFDSELSIATRSWQSPSGPQ